MFSLCVFNLEVEKTCTRMKINEIIEQKHKNHLRKIWKSTTVSYDSEGRKEGIRVDCCELHKLHMSRRKKQQQRYVMIDK